MSYGIYDFSESLSGIDPDTIEVVLAAWGNVDTEDACCDECGGEWSGGFLLKFKEDQPHRYAYITGWCDYTGWGCQDGTSVDYFETLPDLDTLFPDKNYDIEPTDLNKWIADPKRNKLD